MKNKESFLQTHPLPTQRSSSIYRHPPHTTKHWDFDPPASGSLFKRLCHLDTNCPRLPLILFNIFPLVAGNNSALPTMLQTDPVKLGAIGHNYDTMSVLTEFRIHIYVGYSKTHYQVTRIRSRLRPTVLRIRYIAETVRPSSLACCIGP